MIFAKTSLICEAISGYGVLSEPVQPHWVRTLGFVKTSTYDFQSYTPDAVVMLIGPNDPSEKKHSQFVHAYFGFMKLVASQYAYASIKPKIIHICGGSINGLDPCDGKLTPAYYESIDRLDNHCFLELFKRRTICSTRMLLVGSKDIILL